MGNLLQSTTLSVGNSRKKPPVQTNFEELVTNALEQSAIIDPFQESIPVGAKISSTEAMNWDNSKYNDIRPRLYDKGSKIHRLIDTGSMITTTKR